MKKSVFLALLFAANSFAASFPALGIPQSTSAVQTIGSNTYTWTYTCGGGTCLSGTFIGGDPWIAPKVSGEEVVLVSVTTTGTDAGIEINPISTNTQGLLPISAINKITIASGNAYAGDTVTIQGTTVTFVAASPTGNQVLIGADNKATAANLQVFLEASRDANLALMTYSTTSNATTIIARVLGGAGNAYTLTKSGTNISVTSGTFYGGEAYSASLNKSGSLPLVVDVNSSIVKATSKTTNCHPHGSAVICIDTLGVLTVLPKSVNTISPAFRPGMVGSTKTIYTLQDFDLTKIPSDARVTTALGGAPDFAAIHTTWHTPYVDIYMKQLPVGLGDGGRAMVPLPILDYGAAQGSQYINDLISVMGADSVASKLPAITGLLQRGIDLYTAYKAGITWPTGAGQNVGRKPPIVFFASLVKNPSIATEIAGIAASNSNNFQEDGQVQIYADKGNVPIWGDPLTANITEHSYWQLLYSSQYYDNHPRASYFAGDSKKTLADPYGYIDGPAGLPGSNYMACCSSGPFTDFQVAQSLMPTLCSANNDPVLSAYVRRINTTGTHDTPDPCAPPDVRENAACTPYKWSTTNHRGCAYYGSEANGSTTDNTLGTAGTWGPILNAGHAVTGMCIQNNTGGNTGQTGRYSMLDHTMLTMLYRSTVATTLITNVGVSILNGCN